MADTSPEGVPIPGRCDRCEEVILLRWGLQVRSTTPLTGSLRMAVAREHILNPALLWGMEPTAHREQRQWWY